MKKGLLITIDEVQKINQDDLVRIGNAVQGARPPAALQLRASKQSRAF